MVHWFTANKTTALSTRLLEKDGKHLKKKKGDVYIKQMFFHYTRTLYSVCVEKNLSVSW